MAHNLIVSTKSFTTGHTRSDASRLGSKKEAGGGFPVRYNITRNSDINGDIANQMLQCLSRDLTIDRETTLITLPPHYPKMSKMMQTLVFAASVICAVNSFYLEKRGK